MPEWKASEEEVLRRPWRSHVRDLCHYRFYGCKNVSGGDKENECMTARLCRVEDGVYSWVPFICRVRFTSPVSAARQDLWPEDRPAHGVVLPQTSRGHRKRGRKNRWGVLLWTRPGPRCRFYLLSCLCNARLPQHPSTDVIFMWQNDSRKRIIHFYLLPCQEPSSLSAAVLTLPLHHYQHPPFPLFCVLMFLFFFYLSDLKSFVCKGHETAGMVSVRAVYEIAQVKAQDECFKMRNSSMETVVKCIIGSARSLGIKVVNE